MSPHLFLDCESKPLRPNDGSPEWADDAKDPFKASPIVIALTLDGEPIEAIVGHDERQLLEALDHLFREWRLPGDAIWTAHYAPYDLRLLHAAAIRNGMRDLADAIPRKLWDRRMYCTMKEAMGANPRGYVSLDNLARAYGHPAGKGELADIDFPALWAAGNEGLSVLSDRCITDVELLRWVWSAQTGEQFDSHVVEVA